MAEAFLPTPKASDTGTEGRRAGPSWGSEPLSAVVIPLGNGLLPTPRARDHKGTTANPNPSPTLPDAVAGHLLPTPRAGDGKHGSPNQHGSAGDLMLTSAVIQNLPTPRARDWKAGGKDGLEEALLPTPTATPYGTNQTPSEGAAVRPSLSSLAPTLPTPVASDSRGSGSRNLEGSDAHPGTSLTDALCRDAAELGEVDQAPAPARHEQLEILPPGTLQPARWGKYARAIARWEAVVGRLAPPATVLNRKGRPRLNPAFVEWMMGQDPGHVTEVPGISSNQALKALGNGVVRQQAVQGVRLLRQRSGWGRHL